MQGAGAHKFSSSAASIRPCADVSLFIAETIMRLWITLAFLAAALSGPVLLMFCAVEAVLWIVPLTGHLAVSIVTNP